jgi:hypothetical protein
MNIKQYGENEVRLLIVAGQRVAQISNPRRGTYRIPTDLLAMGAGKDAWMRDVLVKCGDCREEHKASDLNSGLYCMDCVEAGLAEDEA